MENSVRNLSVTCEYPEIIETDKGTKDGRMTKPLMVVILTVSIITILVNLAVFTRTVRLVWSRRNVKPAFYFIGNLALSDLSIGICVSTIIIIDILENNLDWQKLSCIVQICYGVTVCLETIFTIILIAVEKYIFICHSMRYPSIVTKRRVYISLIASWILALTIGLLPAMAPSAMMEPREECDPPCSLPDTVSKLYTLLLFIFAVVIPYSIIVCLYSVILVLALKHGKERKKKGQDKGSLSHVRLTLISKKSKSSATQSTAVSKSSGQSIFYDLPSNSMPNLDDLQCTCNEEGTSSREIVCVTADKNCSAHAKADNIRSMNVSYDNTINNCDIKAAGHSDGPENEAVSQESSSGLNNVGFSTFYDKPCPETNDNHVCLNSLNSRKTSDVESDNSSQERTRRNSSSQRIIQLSSKILKDTKNKVYFFKNCRPIKTVFLIIGSFSITYVPYICALFAYKVGGGENSYLLHFLNNLLYCAVVANSLFNPIIYAYGYKEFRVRTKNFKGVIARNRTIRITTIRFLKKKGNRPSS